MRDEKTGESNELNSSKIFHFSLFTFHSHITHYALLIALFLFMTALGARSLSIDAIWVDEWWSIYHAGGAHYGPISLAETIERVASEDPWNAPGYYVVLKGWGALVGWSPLAGRTLSLLFGVLAAAAAYRMGRDIAGSFLTGFSAAFVIGGSAFFIYYLHELRAYSLYALLVTLTLWAYWRVISGKSNRGVQITLLLSIAGMLYAHYFSALLIAAIGLYHLLFIPRDTSWWRAPLLIGAGVLLFLPWAAVLLRGIGASSEAAVRQEPLSEAWQTFNTLLYAFSSAAVPLLLLILLAAAWRWWRTKQDSALRFAWFVTLSVLILALLLNAYLSANLFARHFIVLLPPVALLVGLGLPVLSRTLRVNPAVFFALWTAAALWNTFTPTFNEQLFGDMPYFRIYLPWHTMSSTLVPNVQQDDVIVFRVAHDAPGVSSPFEFYMHDLDTPANIMEWWIPGDGTQAEKLSAFEGQARGFTQNAARIWLGTEGAPAPDVYSQTFMRVINPRFVPCDSSIELNGLRADLYARALQCCHPPQDNLSIFNYGSLALTYDEITQTDAEIEVLLAWSGGDTLPAYQYSVALHLTALDDAVPLAQEDYALPVESNGCRIATIPTADLPSGNYALRVIVYHWQTNERLTADGEGNSPILATVVIGE